MQSRDGGAVGEFNDEMSGGVADECVGWRSSLWLRRARDAALLHRGRRGARLRGKRAGKKKTFTLCLPKTIGT